MNSTSPMPGKQVVDSWTKDQEVLYQRNNYLTYVYTHLEDLRNASGFRPRLYVAPDPILQPLRAASSIYYQVKTIPGTVIYAVSCYAPFAFSFQLYDSHGRTAFAEPISSSFAVSTGTGTGLLYFTEPFVLADPGLITVEMDNQTLNDITAQVVLWCAEPLVTFISPCAPGQC